jgi:hypothetical protein
MVECPHCQYPLPDPPPRFCPSCGRELSADAPPPIPNALGPGTGTPWERRRTIGVAAGLTETTQQVLTGPERFFHAMPVTGGVTDPLLYGLIVSYVGLVATTVYNLVFNATFGSAFSGLEGRPELEPFLPFLTNSVSLLGNLIFGPVLIVVSLFVWAGILHLLLLLLGGGARGYEATFRVLAYASAANLVQIVPLCGSFIAPVYSMVLLVIGLAAAHGDSKGKTAAAVLIPLLLCCCCCLLVAMMFAGGIASLANQAR